MDIEAQRKQMQLERIERRRAAKKRRRFKQRITAIVTVTALTALSAGWVYTASAKEVTLTEINEFDGTSETVVLKTRVNSVQEVLNENGVTIGDADKLNVSQHSELGDENNIVITRGKQITIKSGGSEEVVNVTKAEATDALVEAGYLPQENDEITIDGANVATSDTIELVAVDSKEVEVTSSVDFDTEYVEDSTLEKGKTKVITEGEKGEKVSVQKVTYRDGEEISRETLSEDITSEPVTQVVAKGTKEAVKTVTSPSKGSVFSSDTGNTINGMKYTKKITMQATAYSTSPSENGGYTVSAMGNPLGHGIVAIDPSVVPLGSKVYVESTDGSWTYGIASAEDTGGAIKGNRIDLCYEGSVASVNTFGRRSCNVYILE